MYMFHDEVCGERWGDLAVVWTEHVGLSMIKEQ